MARATQVIQSESMKFIPLANSSGWFTVKLWDIRMAGESIGVPATVFNSGKGVIVDSGTTDTYLPKKLATQFKQLWKQKTGSEYANTRYTFSTEEMQALPTFEFVFHGQDEREVIVHMRPDAYLEHQGSNRYVPRVYLTESTGAVLGANFMQDHNVLFDEHSNRIGFARSDCSYERRLRLETHHHLNYSDRRTSDQPTLGGPQQPAAPVALDLPPQDQGRTAASYTVPSLRPPCSRVTLLTPPLVQAVVAVAAGVALVWRIARGGRKQEQVEATEDGSVAHV
jgi:hypothetical protein